MTRKAESMTRSIERKKKRDPKQTLRAERVLTGTLTMTKGRRPPRGNQGKAPDVNR